MKKFVIIFGIVIFFGLVAGGIYYFFEKPSPLEQNTPETQTPETQVPEIQTPKTKTYRNEEWGFEFRYPEKWTFEVNSFYSPFSKFNLQGDSSAESYNPLIPIFLINIVTPDFADNAAISRQGRGAVESEIFVRGIEGKKYEYTTEYAPKISIDLPFGEYRMIIATYKKYEDVFNQILATFKFLK